MSGFGTALRAELKAGIPARELIALEPLLAEFDGLEIAAAAVRLIERDARGCSGAPRGSGAAGGAGSTSSGTPERPERAGAEA